MCVLYSGEKKSLHKFLLVEKLLLITQLLNALFFEPPPDSQTFTVERVGPEKEVTKYHNILNLPTT